LEQERKELLNNESEDRAKNKTGLVLEGGGMRGIYTAGVLDVFLDEGLEFDGVIGVSAGAVHGCSFLSGQRGRSIRYYKKYCADKRFMSAENMIRTGNFVTRISVTMNFRRSWILMIMRRSTAIRRKRISMWSAAMWRREHLSTRSFMT